MSSRRLHIEFEKLIRSTNPELEFDPNLITDTIFMFLTMAQEKVISDTFLQSPELLQNIQAIQKRSDILRNIIKRGNLTNADYVGQYNDGGRSYVIDFNDYWIYLNGVLKDTGFSALKGNVGGTNNIVSIKVVTHDELTNVRSDIYDEPILENVPALLEEDKTLVLYLDKDKEDVFTSGTASLEIEYLAHPPEITTSVNPVLPESMYRDIVKIAVEDFIVNYKYKLMNKSDDR